MKGRSPQSLPQQELQDKVNLVRGLCAFVKEHRVWKLDFLD